MKKLIIPIIIGLLFSGCDANHRPSNISALDEQSHTEINQRALMQKQPPPFITWSLERDNLIKRFKLQNDRNINFYMYVFIEGCPQPIGYYLINKVSSVNSHLTNTQQIVTLPSSSEYRDFELPSPDEDGSYGENGNGVFGFTPDGIYIEHNMKYITSTVPLQFEKPVILLAIINDTTRQIIKTTNKTIQ